jgi:DNA-binding transcriptional regulator YhcF (GntR family)
MSFPLDNFTIDKSLETPYWRQLSNRIIELIQGKELLPLQKMPTVRGLSQSLGVSPSVVCQSYRYLCGIGYLEARQGSGYRVRQRGDSVKDSDFPALGKIINTFIDDCLRYGVPLSEVTQTVSYAVAARTLEKGEKLESKPPVKVPLQEESCEACCQSNKQ